MAEAVNKVEYVTLYVLHNLSRRLAQSFRTIALCVLYTMLVQHFEPQGWRFRNVHYYYYLRKISLFTFYTNFLCAIHNLPLRLHNLFPLHVLNNLSLRITQSLPTFTLSFSTFYTAFLYVLHNLSLFYTSFLSVTIFLYVLQPFLYVLHNLSVRDTQQFSAFYTAFLSVFPKTD